MEWSCWRRAWKFDVVVDLHSSRQCFRVLPRRTMPGAILPKNSNYCRSEKTFAVGLKLRRAMAGGIQGVATGIAAVAYRFEVVVMGVLVIRFGLVVVAAVAAVLAGLSRK